MSSAEAAALARVFDALEDSAAELAESICVAAEEQIDFYRMWRDQGNGDRLRSTITLIVEHFAATRGMPEVAGELSDIGALRATQGLPLDAIPTCWLIITDHVWRWVLERTGDAPSVELTALWTRFLDYVRASAGAIQASYVTSRSETYAAEVIAAREILDHLIHGSSMERTEAALTEAGHREAGLRILLWRPEETTSAIDPDVVGPRPTKMLLARLSDMAGRRVLPWTMWEDAGVVVVPPHFDKGRLGDVFAQVPGARVVLSRVVPTRVLLRPIVLQNLPLFRLTTAESPIVNAEELSLLQLTAARLAVDSDEVPPWLREFFAGDDTHDRAWSQTARALIRTNYNIGQAARELFVHQNTIYYRLETIRKHCGVDIREPAQMADLHLAMLMRDVAAID